VSFPVALLFLPVGLLLGSFCWVTARNLADGRLPWEPLRCHPDRPGDAACPALLPRLASLPLYRFGSGRQCPACEQAQTRGRYFFGFGFALYLFLAALRIEHEFHFAAVAFFAVILSVILLLDYWSHLLFTNLVFGGTILGLVYWIIEDGSDGFIRTSAAIAIASAIFAFFYIFAKSIYKSVQVAPFGTGDIYLAAMIGAMVGLNDLLKALIFGVLFMGGGAMLLIFRQQLKTRQSMPYGPFLCLGALIAMIW
jgi:leader peptidase (prepilin peptidase)/N-methyltransferase